MQMKKKKSRTIELNFPERTWNYWYLIWIGKIHYQKRQRKVELYFYNKKSPTDYFGDLDRTGLYMNLVAISCLSELKIGSIYDTREKKVIDFNQGQGFDIFIRENLYLAKKEFPLNRNQYFIENSNEIVPPGFTYLKAFGKNDRESRMVLISPYTIIQYFLFNNDVLINNAFSGELIEGFKLKEIVYYKCKETGELIGKLKFDTEKLSKDQAIILAPYMFFKDGSGIKFLKSIYSHVNKAFLDRLSGKKSTYLSFHWDDFRNYEIMVQGKPYFTVSANGKEEYLLAYQINSFKFKDRKPYIVDKIELYPISSKDSTDDRENHDPEVVNRPRDPETESIALNLNADMALLLPPINTPVETEQGNPFNIPVELIKRDQQNNAYIVNHIPNNDAINSVTRDLEYLENESESIRENIKNIIITVGKFEYFREVLNVLKEEFFSKSSSFHINSYPPSFFQKSFHIAEISYLSKYIYLVEFGSGIIGVFNSGNLNKISTERLSGIISAFLQKEDKVESGKVLWTQIKNKFENEFYERYYIVIHTGVKHLNTFGEVKAKNAKESIRYGASRCAKNIYNNRIKNVIV